MFKRFRDSDKWKDYIRISDTEIKIAILLTIIIIAFLYHLNFYGDFNEFQHTVSELLAMLCAGFMGLLGFSLSGIAIIATLFSYRQIKIIEEYSRPKVIDDILVSYEFLAFNLSWGILWFILLYISVSSSAALLNEVVFWFLSFSTIYFVIFVLFYTVGLTGNCIRLYGIKNKYEEIEECKKSVYDSANEIRIDYLLFVISEMTDKSIETIVTEIKQLADESDDINKELLLKYLNKVYQE